jgi:hypothetical protein
VVSHGVNDVDVVPSGGEPFSMDSGCPADIEDGTGRLW